MDSRKIKIRPIVCEIIKVLAGGFITVLDVCILRIYIRVRELCYYVHVIACKNDGWNALVGRCKKVDFPAPQH